ncbi:MAG: shikimate kinase, partial [[Clostridium] fimetarium]|nr:shikimate kinase [[Clostridium] fimetarium]
MPDTATHIPGPVYLIGFMGSGKTTLGRALAAANPALRYVDLDEEVERRAGMSVREIFARHGERRFRQLESEALRDFASERNLIVGCGGGTPCQPGNMGFMNARGLTVLLRASDEALLRRLT